jgi:MIP family channel proteins
MPTTSRPTRTAQTPTDAPSTTARLTAEALGTFILVFAGVGTVLFATLFPATDGMYLPIALAFGLSVVAGAYAFGHVSGAHFNPAVTLGAAFAGRLPWKDVIGYLVAQVVGGIIATALLFAIAAGKDGFLAKAQSSGFASTGYAERSPGGFSLVSVLLIEVILTALFVYVILGVTDRRAPAGFAPLAIGLALTMLLLVGLPVSGASLNPARSIASAVFGDGVALGQVWAFVVAPIVGGILAGVSYKPLFARAQ